MKPKSTPATWVWMKTMWCLSPLRVTDRWRLEGNGFSTNNSGSGQIRERIEWGPLEFEAGANVKIKNDTSIIRGAIGYSFFENQPLSTQPTGYKYIADAAFTH